MKIKKIVLYKVEIPMITSFTTGFGTVNHRPTVIVKIEDDKVKVFITPTYSGCPAMKAIENDISDILRKHDINSFEVKTVFSPVWTTDWISDEAKERLRKYGISPPEKSTSDKNILLNKHVRCPQCNSENTTLISQFGSTACKALYKCNDCLEPFDHFKCH